MANIQSAELVREAEAGAAISDCPPTVDLIDDQVDPGLDARVVYRLLTLDRRADGVAVVTLTNGKINTLSQELVTELMAVAGDLTADPPGAVVVSGGDHIFAAGADVAQFDGPEQAAVIGATVNAALDTLAAVPRFVVAAISGYALGAGCALALACDYRIATDDAVFGMPEVLLGIVPGGGGTQRLSRTVGVSRAKEICITGRQVKADEALRIGLADELVPRDELHDRALSLAAEVAGGASVAQSICKRVIDEGASAPLLDGLAAELAGFVEVFRSEDARIGVGSFLEHGLGKAEFVGR